MSTLEETAENRTASEVLAWSRDLVDPALRAAVDTLPGSMRRIADYHFGWWDESGRPDHTARGKAIRPALTLLTAQAVGGCPAESVPAAVAVELVHNFSLLHDDVMDGDMTRRHRPTAWTRFGRNAAILAGNALLSLAFDVLATCDQPATQDAARILNAAVLKLLDGQSSDMTFEVRTDVGLTECMTMVAGKTGALLGCACALGASFGNGRPDQVENLRCFGERLGLAFQIVDDLLGIWGDPTVTGKPIHSDLVSRKKSLPVVAALSSGSAAGQELSALYHRDEPLSDAQLAHAAELIDLAGGRAWSQCQADSLLSQALLHLCATKPAQEAAPRLQALARMITRRDH